MIKVVLFFIVLLPGQPPHEKTMDMPSYEACVETLNTIPKPKFDPRAKAVVLVGCQIQHEGGDPA